MSLAALAQRLDELFELERHAEPDGWDFGISPESKRTLLAHGSAIFQRTFNGLIHFGLPVDAAVDRIYLLVFPEESLVDRVIRAERAINDGRALIVTHHPIDMETRNTGFVDIPMRQMAELAETGCALYVLHAPLDCHATISTSGALADGLGLTRERTFAPYVGGQAGVIGVQAPERFSTFAERVRHVCELPGFDLEAVRFAGRLVSRVAIVAGGGDDVADFAQAEMLGCDTFLAGHWWTPHHGEWPDANRLAIADAIRGSGMNFLSASHDGSELVVFRDQLLPLFREWGYSTRLLRQADHWR